MPNTVQLSFTKVVFQPTPTAWAHTYTAGSFFVVTSLAVPTPPEESDINAIGKEIFTKLETEFFTLEQKNLANIKQVIQMATDHIPTDMMLSLTAAYIKDSILYVFVAGGGSVILKRDEQLGTILTVTQPDNHTLKAASGYLYGGDVLVLETLSFMQHVSLDTLTTLADHLPNEMAESVNSRLQTADNSTDSCIIIKVEGQRDAPDIHPAQPSLTSKSPLHEEQTFPSQEMQQSPLSSITETPPHHPTKQPMHLPQLSFPSFLRLQSIRIPVKTKFGLSLAVIVLIILAASIMAIQSNRQQAANRQIFNSYYPQAKSDYDSANAIAKVDATSPNRTSDYQKAQSLLQAALQHLPAQSDQAKQVSALLTDVTNAIQTASNIQQVTVTNATANDSSLLHLESTQNVRYVTTDGTTNYYITTSGIYTDKKTTPIIKNSSDWQTVGGFGTYEGNFYILDKKDGILKYVSGNSGYGKSQYFAKDTSPDESNAVALAIDSSIYVLQSNGNVIKYTRGEPDSFSIKGLDKPFSSPTRIVTDASMNSIYILDNGNSRIVQLGKDGTFQAQYVNDALNKAKDMDVQESNKKIFILTSDGSIKSINIE